MLARKWERAIQGKQMEKASLINLTKAKHNFLADNL